MNTFEPEFYDNKRIGGFEIQFAKESKYGDTLGVFKKNTGDGEYSFLIKNEDEAVVLTDVNDDDQYQEQEYDDVQYEDGYENVQPEESSNDEQDDGAVFG